MKASKRWHFSSLVGILLCLTILTSNASAAEKKFQWGTRLTLSEQYDDNVNLDRDNEDHDWITFVRPGITLAILTEKTPISLDYDFGYAHYARDTNGDTFRHTLTLSGLEGVPIAKHLTLDLRESLFISDEPIEEAEGVTSVRRSRRKYYRNTADGRINYLFGAEDSLYVGFHHVFLENNDPTVQDSQRYGPTGGINYWFSIRNGLSLDFLYDRADFDDSIYDFDQYIGTATYTYRFSPRTQTTLAYTIDSFDYEEDIRESYVVHSGSLGLSHQFTKNTAVAISGGYWLQDPDRSDSRGGFQGTVNFTQALEKLSFTLEGSRGYRTQYIEAEDLGFSEFYRASARLDWRPLEKLTATLSGFFQRDDYKETIDNREDDNWAGNASLNYLLLPWLSASLSYDYRRMDSNINSEDYTDNRVTFSLVAFYLSIPKSF